MLPRIKESAEKGEILTKAYNSREAVWAIGYEMGMHDAGCADVHYPWKERLGS